MNYMVIQAQVVCELNLKKRKHTTCTFLEIGKQPCLWCLVTLDDLEKSCSLRAPFPEQTLQSMFDDYKRFEASGGDIRKVKFFK